MNEVQNKVKSIKVLRQSTEYPTYYLVNCDGAFHVCQKIDGDMLEHITPDFGNWQSVGTLFDAENFEHGCYVAEQEIAEMVRAYKS